LSNILKFKRTYKIRFKLPTDKVSVHKNDTDVSFLLNGQYGGAMITTSTAKKAIEKLKQCIPYITILEVTNEDQ
tara:strand:+ start:107 stop:328 length:222 start_codon:yes stop_codon:yes gene_type:complete